MPEKGLYDRASDKLLEILPMVKGETLTRDEIYKMCNVSPTMSNHASFRKAINDVLYNWTTVNKKRDRVVRNGKGFKFIDDSLTRINFLNADRSRFELELPFGIHKYCYLHRKNIGIVMGTKDAGKSAFLINIARMNMRKHRTLYFSSEMVDAELAERLSKVKGIALDEWAIEAYERSYDFDEVIDPNGLNLIDFLELGGTDSEYYQGVGLIRKIYDKLENGVAFIACQKSFGIDYPRGGEGMLEKARIAVALESNSAKLVVGKNWADGVTVSPKGKEWTYSLVGGVNYVNIMDAD